MKRQPEHSFLKCVSEIDSPMWNVTIIILKMILQKNSNKNIIFQAAFQNHQKVCLMLKKIALSYFFAELNVYCLFILKVSTKQTMLYFLKMKTK